MLRNAIAFGAGYSVNKEDWNKFLMAIKSSTSDSLKDVLRFLSRWAGVPQNPTFAF